MHATAVRIAYAKRLMGVDGGVGRGREEILSG